MMVMQQQKKKYNKYLTLHYINLVLMRKRRKCDYTQITKLWRQKCPLRCVGLNVDVNEFHVFLLI